MGLSVTPVTTRRMTNNSRELPTPPEEVATPVEEQSSGFACVCGRSFSTLKGRNIHRGRMKCDWGVDSSSGSEPVNPRELPSPDQNHSARDIQRLLSEKHGVSPPAGRNEKICWPASNDKAWLEFDDRVCEKLTLTQKNKPYQEKMRVHCEVVYEEAVRWFGIVEKPSKEVAVVHANRRQKQIDSLVRERRSLRKRLRKASSDIEKDGYEALLKDVAERLKKVRRAETRRKKQRERRRTNKSFKNDPFRTIKNVLTAGV